MHQKRVIAIISQDKEVDRLCAIIDAKNQEVHERVTFLKKQIDDVLEAARSDLNPIWDEMARHIEGKNPGLRIDNKNDLVGFSRDEDAVHMLRGGKHTHGSPASFLQKLFT